MLEKQNNKKKQKRDKNETLCLDSSRIDGDDGIFELEADA